jgi:hypothetical protein
MAQAGIWVAFALLLTAYLVLFGILLTVNVSLALFLLGLGVLFYSLFVIIYLTVTPQTPINVAHFTPVCSSEFIGGSESVIDGSISGGHSGISPAFGHGDIVKGTTRLSPVGFGLGTSVGRSVFPEGRDEIIGGRTSGGDLIDGADLTSVNIDLLGSVQGSSGHISQSGIAIHRSSGGLISPRSLRESRIAGGRRIGKGNVSGTDGRIIGGRGVDKFIPVGTASDRDLTSGGSSDISNNPKRRLRIGSRFN